MNVFLISSFQSFNKLLLKKFKTSSLKEIRQNYFAKLYLNKGYSNLGMNFKLGLKALNKSKMLQSVSNRKLCVIIRIKTVFHTLADDQFIKISICFYIGKALNNNEIVMLK